MMRKAGYKIDLDPANRLVRMTLYGFWDEKTLRDYQDSIRRLAAAAPQPRPAAERPRILIDLRDHDLLSKEHAAELQAMLGGIGGAYRTAVVMSHIGLLKKQVERVSATLRPMFFTSEPDAMDWLLGKPAEMRTVAAV